MPTHSGVSPYVYKARCSSAYMGVSTHTLTLIESVRGYNVISQRVEIIKLGMEGIIYVNHPPPNLLKREVDTKDILVSLTALE